MTAASSHSAMECGNIKCDAWGYRHEPPCRVQPISRPRLLDLYCCQGGAARGYDQAGFEVVGVDIEPQPRYPYEFHQGDALVLAERLLGEQHFDAIHASPPCQGHSALRHATGKTYESADLLGLTLTWLAGQGLPYIVENVEGSSSGAIMGNPLTLCGSSFGLQVDRDGLLMQVRRHRYFVTSFAAMAPPCQHSGAAMDVTGHGMQGREYRRRQRLGLPLETHADRQAAMGIDWMTRDGMAQSIPPAFTRYLGEWLLEDLAVAA